MKTIMILLIAALTTICGRVSAQDLKEAEHRADCHTQWMQKELKLDNYQVKKVKEINMDISKKMEEAKYSTASVGEVTAKAKDLDVEKDKKLESVLSARQLFRYQRIKEKVPQLASSCILTKE
jgi:hypothetical protein